MTATAERLKDELVGLSADDRANLAAFLIHSLPPPAAMSGEEFDAELASRAEAIRQGTAVGEPVENVVAELRAKFS